MPSTLPFFRERSLGSEPHLRARRGAIELPAGVAALIGALVGVSLVVGAFGGYRLGIVSSRRAADAALAAAPGGILIVDSASADATSCGGEPAQAKTRCVRALLDRHIDRGGVANALATLRTLAQSDPDVEHEAHMFAHGIGIDAFEKHPDIDATFTHCTAEFSSGCYHGVLQAYFEMRGTADPKVVREACHPYEGDPGKRWLLFQCLHGMGHGLNMALDHNLPQALTACDLLGERWDRESCYGGAFMENITHVIIPDHPATLLVAEHEKAQKADDGMSMAGMHMGPAHPAAGPPFKAIDSTNPQYPCSTVSDRYGRECYRIQTALTLYLNHGNLSKSAHDCDGAPKTYRPYCYESLGRDISAISGYHADAAVRLCTVGTLTLRKYCYAGTAESFVDEQARADAGFAVCALLPTAHDKPLCYERVGELVLSLAATPDDRSRMCALPSPADTRACRKGAQLPTEPPRQT